MLINGAIVEEKGDIRLEEMTIAEPKADEVRVKMVGTGICHTDLSVANQAIDTPLPIVLGHEGAGIIEKVGENVTNFQEGDNVVLSFAFCNTCDTCLQGNPGACENLAPLNFSGTMIDGTKRIRKDDEDVATLFGQSSLATYAIAHESHLVKVDQDVDISIMGPLACGIQTGAGVVLKKLKPEFGSSIAIFGCGGVGLSAVMSANLLGCDKIIAVDVNDDRLELAKELGATHVFNGSETDDIVEEIQSLTDGGVEYSFDSTAVPQVINQALNSLAVNGTLAVVGVGGEVPVEMYTDVVIPNRTIVGVTQGASVPSIFIPELVKYYNEGRFPFDKLIKKYTLDQLSEALDDMESGETIKPVIVFE